MQIFGTKGQKFLLCPGTKGQWDKLKILPRNRPGLDFDILHHEEPGHDFDSMFCPVLEYPGTAMGQKGRKSNKFFLTFLTFFLTLRFF